MSKESEIFCALYDLRQNYFHGEVTIGPCCTDACNNCAREGGKCGDCCEKEMADIMGWPLAARSIHKFTQLAHSAIDAALDHIKEMEKKD
jgi:hypothetical protein